MFARMTAIKFIFLAATLCGGSSTKLAAMMVDIIERLSSSPAARNWAVGKLSLAHANQRTYFSAQRKGVSLTLSRTKSFATRASAMIRDS